MWRETSLRIRIHGFRQPRTSEKTQKSGSYLIQPWLVIGDAIFALEVAERIWKHQPHAQIDLFCTDVQLQIFTDHPRTVVGTDQPLPQSDYPSMRLLPIPRNFYDRSEQMEQKRQEYANLLPEYETVFIEDPINFRLLFGTKQNYTHNSFLPLKIQAIIEKLFPLPSSFWDVPKYIRTRVLVDAYFDALPSWGSERAEPVSLFLAHHRIAEAHRRAVQLKEQAERTDGLLLLVNADTSSPVTKPPTELLISGIAKALLDNPHLVVGILPGYTCPQAHEQVYKGLAALYGKQIQYVEPASQPEHVLDTTAFIDQADIFVTGDTGLMHMAATKKITRGGEEHGPYARNNLSIISLWGGTRPGYWGYPKLTTIIGGGGGDKGNSLQRQMYPGIRKYLWLQKKADYFGHIYPDQLTSAIVTSASSFPGSETERQPISEP